MAYCKGCGGALDEGRKFCRDCGLPVGASGAGDTRELPTPPPSAGEPPVAAVTLPAASSAAAPSTPPGTQVRATADQLAMWAAVLFVTCAAIAFGVVWMLL